MNNHFRVEAGKTVPMFSFFRRALLNLMLPAMLAFSGLPASAQTHRGGGEANLILPDLSQAKFFGGVDGRSLLMIGLVVAAAGSRRLFYTSECFWKLDTPRWLARMGERHLGEPFLSC